jgi:butyryl-CoA dehydrogenase
MLLGLSGEHEAIRAVVRKFAETEIAPLSEKLFEKQAFSYDIWKRAGELGFLGVPYPEEFGGGGGSWLMFLIVLEEIARVDCAVASTVMANSSVASLLSNFGTKAQKEKYLTPILTGEQIGAIGLTEPNAGSDAAALKTKATLVDDKWVINGSKMFITNSGTDITGPNFILPHGTPGFNYGRKLEKIGWRASTTNELFFENCVLPKENLLGERGAGMRQTLSTISTGRILIGGMALGILQGSLDRSKSYMKERTTFGKALAEYQVLQFKIADMATDTHAARLMLYNAAATKDAGCPFDQEASMAKLFATEKAMHAAHQAIQIHGGYGIITEFPAARALGDAKVLEIVEGTSEIQRMIISKMQLK